MAKDEKISPDSGLIEARTLSGFRDYLPGIAMLKGRMLQQLRDVFQSFGYVPIETPHIEHAEVLLGKAGSEIGKQIYRFRDLGDRDVALRFDLTVPLARFIVQHRTELGLPFKRYAIGEAFRGEKAQAGRYREFTQCDFDFIGSYSTSADAEIIQVIAAALTALSIPDFTVRISNRKLMNGLVEHLGAGEKTADILRIVDKLDKVGEPEVEKSLRTEVQLSAEQVSGILSFVTLSATATGPALFERLNPYERLNPGLAQGVRELRQVAAILQEVGLNEKCYRMDFSIVRGLGYYTGIVFETILNQLPQIGSVCGGGRFDDLTKSFSNEQLPGVGASVGIDRLIAALEELGIVHTSGTPAQVLFTQMSDDLSPLVHRRAAELRALGIKAEVYPEASKLRKQFEYANRKGHAIVVTIGSDEAQAGSMSIKQMASGEQKQVKTAAELKALLG